MDFVRISDAKIKLTLTDADMKKYGVTEKDLSADTTARRRILWTLLDEAKQKTGMDALGAKTLVEMFPGRHGGCELFITLLRGKSELHTACYRFRDITRVRLAAEKLGAPYIDEENAALYTLKDGEAVLVLSVAERGNAHTLSPHSFLKEYGEREKSPLFHAYTKEYGTCLYETRAIRRLVEEKNDFSV